MLVRKPTAGRWEWISDSLQITINDSRTVQSKQARLIPSREEGCEKNLIHLCCGGKSNSPGHNSLLKVGSLGERASQGSTVGGPGCDQARWSRSGAQ